MSSFNWFAGVGNLTLMGWLAVSLYYWAAMSCWVTARKVRLGAEAAEDTKELRGWRSMTAAFFALGINKQLDLQTALGDAGRSLARSQGWYDQRQLAQIAFVALVAIMCLIAALILVRWMRKAPAPTWLALAGSIAIIGFVLIRAASFHHFDRLIYARGLGVRWNWILEIGGIGVVLAASHWRQSEIGRLKPGLLRKG